MNMTQNIYQGAAKTLEHLLIHSVKGIGILVLFRNTGSFAPISTGKTGTAELLGASDLLYSLS